MSSEARKIVEEAIKKVMRDAKAAGQRPMAMALQKFPDCPISVLGGLEWEVTQEEEDEWWRQVENAIDVEIIANALPHKKKGGK